MSTKCGIVGLPNVGKSSLFNVLQERVGDVPPEEARGAGDGNLHGVTASAGIAVTKRPPHSRM